MSPTPSQARRRRNLPGLAVACAALIAFALPTPAVADEGHKFAIAWTGIGIYPHSSPDMREATRSGPAVPDGTVISVACELVGQSVTSPVTTTSVWAKTTGGEFYPTAFLNTGTNGWTPGVPACPEMNVQEPSPPYVDEPSRGAYNVETATIWAEQNYKTFEQRYGANCTWFVSNALWKGGLEKTGRWTDSGGNLFDQANKDDYPGPTKAAASADHLKNALIEEKDAKISQLDVRVDGVPDARVGDLIFFDWRNGDSPEGHVSHVVMITDIVNGVPYTTGNTPSYTYHQWNTASSGGPMVDAEPKVIPYLVRIG